MHRIAGRAAFVFALVMWVANVAWASDIACSQNYRQRCDVSAPAGASCGDSARIQPHGKQLICEYAMLHETYERIYAEQQHGRYTGTLRKNDLDAWRRKRDACTTVRCLDQLFGSWRSVPQAPALRDAPPRQPMVAESRPAPRRMSPAQAAASGAMAHGATAAAADATLASMVEELNPAAPSFESVPLSLRDSLQPLPPGSARTHRPIGATSTASLPWLPWLLGLLAAGGAFYWLVIRKQATRYLDAAFTSASAGMSWLKTLPMLAFVLGGLALLNGVLLIVLLGG